jgi:hypothetical protein
MLVRLDALSLVQSSSASIERELRIKEGELSEAKRRQANFKMALDKNSESETFQDAVIRVDSQVRNLKKEIHTLQTALAAERGIGWEEFLGRLDLHTYEGRAKANNVVRRQGVIVQIGPSGYMVTQDGAAQFQMDFRNGEAGYLAAGGFKGQFLTFVPVESLPSWVAAEDSDEKRYEFVEDEGQSA